MALFACVCSFQHLFAGLSNRTLRPMVAELIDGYTQGQMTYDLRRLRRKGLIHRIPRTQRYELTDLGRMIAVFFTKTYVRILNPALAELDPQLPAEIANRSDLARTYRAFERALNQRIKQAAIAA
jgi:predicted MarR family transcription regulator